MKDYEKKDLVGRVKLFGERAGLFVAGTALVYGLVSLSGCGQKKPNMWNERDIRNNIVAGVEIPLEDKNVSTFYPKDIDNDGIVDALTWGRVVHFYSEGKEKLLSDSGYGIDSLSKKMSPKMQNQVNIIHNIQRELARDHLISMGLYDTNSAGSKK